MEDGKMTTTTTKSEEFVEGLRRSFETRKTFDLEWRKRQLKALIRMYEEQSEVFASALKADLAKPRQEALLTEVQFNEGVARNALNEIDDWIRTEAADKNLVTLLDSTYCQWEPYGVVLILGPWNYPLQLSLAPLVGAICAGNCVVIKPSELAPATAEAIAKMLPRYLDPECFKVFLGGVEETTELLKVRFDYIFFTGGLKVGKIVASAAARHMTPLTAELGGKCPLYLDESVTDFRRAAKRIVWGKLMNLGQTCVAPDYMLCSVDVRRKFLEAVEDVLQEFYEGSGEIAKANLGRIVNERHYERLTDLLERTRGKFEIKGEWDKSERFIGLTIVSGIEAEDPLMEEELFGPILPIVTVKNWEEAVNFINSKEKPLSLYIFTEDSKVRKEIIDRTSSGSVCVNDVIVQLSVETLPFGGVGASGYGAYHGKYSFECFSHKKSVLVRDLGFIGETIGKFRYPPYSDSKVAWGKTLLRPVKIPSFTILKYTLLLGTGFMLNGLYKILAQKYGYPVPYWI